MLFCREVESLRKTSIRMWWWVHVRHASWEVFSFSLLQRGRYDAWVIQEVGDGSEIERRIGAQEIYRRILGAAKWAIEHSSAGGTTLVNGRAKAFLGASHSKIQIITFAGAVPLRRLLPVLAGSSTPNSDSAPTPPPFLQPRGMHRKHTALVYFSCLTMQILSGAREGCALLRT